MKKSDSSEMLPSLETLPPFSALPSFLDYEDHRLSLDKYYFSIQSIPLIISQRNIFERNVFHNIAICTNDAPKEEQEKLVLNCLEFVLEKIKEDINYYSIVNHRDKFGNTPMDYAVKYNNLYFFKTLITKNIADPWDAVKDKVLSDEIQILLLEHYFGLKLEGLRLNNKMQKLIIDKMEEKHVPFVLKLFDSLEIDLEEREAIITNKIISYNKPEFVSMLITLEVGVLYLERSPNDMLNILTLAIKNQCEDKVIKILLDYTHEFSLTQYNQLITSGIGVSLHCDTEGNNIFHKLVTVPERNREDNFSQLMYDTLKMILEYLDCHQENRVLEISPRPREIIHCVGSFNRTALDVAMGLSQFDFVSALIKLNAVGDEIFESLKYDFSKEMRQLIYDFRLSQIGITIEQLQNLKTKDQAASIMIEMVSEKSLAITIDLFIQYNISLDFQSFSYKPERKTTAAGNTLLHKAVAFEDLAAVNKLIKLKVNLNLQNKEGFTPIAIATSMNNEEIIDALFNAKADVSLCSIKGTTPLHYAVIHFNYNFLEKIGIIDVDKKDVNGNTPLHFAVSAQHCDLLITENNPLIVQLKIIYFLAEAKANVNAVNNNGETPLHCAVRYVAENDKYLNVIKTLLQLTNLCVNLSDVDGNTAMHLATVGGNGKIIKLLHQSGAKIDVVNKKGLKPLDLVNKQSDELIEYIIELGVKTARENYSENKVITTIITSIEQANLLFSGDACLEQTKIDDNQVVFLRLKYLLKITDPKREEVESLYKSLRLIKFDKKLINELFSDYDYIEEESDSSNEEIIYTSINEMSPFKDEEWRYDILEALNKQLKEELEDFEEISLLSGNNGNKTSDDL